MIKGPRLAYWELFDDYTDAFSSISKNPHLIPYTNEKEGYLTSERKGLEKIDKFHRKWRFYLKGTK